MASKGPSLPPAQWVAQEIQARDRDADGYFDYCRRSLGAYGDRAQVLLVLNAARLQPQFRLLDAGCGVGRFAMPIARRVRSVLAVDYSPKSVEVLERETRRHGLTNIEARVADLTNIELPPDSFDVAIAPGVIHHIPTSELRLEAMRRLFQALRPGARMVVLVYRWGGNIHKPRPKEGMHGSAIYYFAYTVSEAKEMMQQAGFTEVRIRGFLSLPRALFRRLPAWIAWLEPLMAWAPWSVLTSHSLLIVGKKAASPGVERDPGRASTAPSRATR